MSKEHPGAPGGVGASSPGVERAPSPGSLDISRSCSLRVRAVTTDGPLPAAGRKPSWWEIVPLVVIIAVGFGWRLHFAANNLEAPLIDENEIVEQAVAFMGGDVRYHFLKYGPLTMYVLAGIYHCLAWMRGLPPLEYASRVFFEGQEHYFVARVLTVGAHSLLAILAFRSFHRRFGGAPALFVASLLALPFLEVLTMGARIDHPQAAFQAAALLLLSDAIEERRARDWVLAGVCAGFGIATKVLPGLLVTPCFLVASWLAAGAAPDGTRRSVRSRLVATITQPGLWLAAAVCVICAVLGNPAMLDVSKFIASQVDAVARHSGPVTWSTQSVVHSFRVMGWPFVLALGASSAAVLYRRDARGLLALCFVALYAGLFWGRASRNYYMVAPIAAACLVIGYGFAKGHAILARHAWLERSRPWLWLPVALCIVGVPFEGIWARETRLTPQTLATRWVHEHMPDGTRLFYFGQRPDGPRIVATNRNLQASWGDHFDRGRDKYRFLKRAFALAYERYAASGRPMYSVEAHDAKPQPKATPTQPRWLSDSLVEKAQSKGCRYIVLAGFRSPTFEQLGYRWYNRATLVAQFRGIAIFEVPAATAASMISPMFHQRNHD